MYKIEKIEPEQKPQKKSPQPEKKTSSSTQEKPVPKSGPEPETSVNHHQEAEDDYIDLK